MSYKITSRYLQKEGFRKNPHTGIDLKMEIGEPLRAIKEGKILIRDYGSTNAGKTILIEAEDGKTYIYGHLSEFVVKNGQHVDIGQLIGYSGNTGHSTGAHLHFGVKSGETGRFLDPSPHVEFIQNMNNPQFLASVKNKTITLTQPPYSMFDVLKETASTYGDIFQNLKLNLIYLLKSIDYAIIIQGFQNLFQFFS
ncbi:M23 family metallopeptidase [uncultured Metabacillus sp.]|uniref:M23 family metallopeptidase n=1 Tax=uncultured Metabacillus sp. TaxID=2860135 RepID=UPI002606AD65|nr:M23 family metallopeptidase [uncultured Metabacillus sp.]